MKWKNLTLPAALAGLSISMACSSQRSVSNETSHQDQVKQALEQAELTDVTVAEDADKNTITLGGSVHSDGAKAEAASVAQAAAGGRVIVNQVSVQPMGSESEAKSMASNRDDAIEDNYKAALIAEGLDQEHIRYDAKNGVLTLKGSVRTTPKRQEAQQLAQAVPNVQQVVNQIQVRR